MRPDDTTSSAHTVRIPPLPTTSWTQAEWEAVSILPDEMRPPPGVEINALDVMAHHPPLSRAILQFSLYLRFESTLSDREREILVLRTAWLRRAEYELLRHARLARRYGFTEAELVAIAAGPTAPEWSTEEALLLRLVDELTGAGRVSDQTWSALEAWFTHQQVMDALVVVGAYTMLAMAYGSIGVQPEDDLDPFPVPFGSSA